MNDFAWLLVAIILGGTNMGSLMHPETTLGRRMLAGCAVASSVILAVIRILHAAKVLP